MKILQRLKNLRGKNQVKRVATTSHNINRQQIVTSLNKPDQQQGFKIIKIKKGK